MQEITRGATMVETTLRETSFNSHYPKIILKTSGDLTEYHVVTRLDAYDVDNIPEWVNDNSPVLQPTEEISLDGDLIELGVDYSTLMMEKTPYGNRGVVYKKVPVPQLSYTGNLSFRWNFSYRIPTTIYRAVVPKPRREAYPEEFEVIAETYPVQEPGRYVDYTDHRSHDFSRYNYIYYVRTMNGKSRQIVLLDENLTPYSITADSTLELGDNTFITMDNI